MSGLTKLHDWSVTVALFTDEYHVPVLPPAIAALMGTTTEISMPLLLALGLATRFGAFVLFFFNIVAVVSYAALPDVAVKDHYLWGALILVVFVFGLARSRSTAGSSAGGRGASRSYTRNCRIAARITPSWRSYRWHAMHFLTCRRSRILSRSDSGFSSARDINRLASLQLVKPESLNTRACGAIAR
jgi:uncharacterized membrane protein YphA (DoxX/SURF4 family)